MKQNDMVAMRAEAEETDSLPDHFRFLDEDDLETSANLSQTTKCD